MHLLKNFGSGGTANGAKTGASTGGAKTSYFSSLNLASQSQKQKKKGKSAPTAKKIQGPPKGFIPQQFALDFDHPTIILEYRDPQTNKLYHHKMPIKKLKKDTPSKQALDYLKKRHYNYFLPKVIEEDQIEKLIQKLKSGLIGDDDIEDGLGSVDEQDFDFDYQDDFDI